MHRATLSAPYPIKKLAVVEPPKPKKRKRLATVAARRFAPPRRNSPREAKKSSDQLQQDAADDPEPTQSAASEESDTSDPPASQQGTASSMEPIISSALKRTAAEMNEKSAFVSNDGVSERNRPVSYFKVKQNESIQIALGQCTSGGVVELLGSVYNLGLARLHVRHPNVEIRSNRPNDERAKIISRSSPIFVVEPTARGFLMENISISFPYVPKKSQEINAAVVIHNTGTKTQILSCDIVGPRRKITKKDRRGTDKVIGLLLAEHGQLEMDRTRIEGFQGTGIMGRGHSEISATNSEFIKNGQNGVWLRYTGKCLLTNCAMDSNGLDGIYADALGRICLNKCRCSNNGRQGMALDFPAIFEPMDGELQSEGHVVKDCCISGNGSLEEVEKRGIVVFAGIRAVLKRN